MAAVKKKRAGRPSAAQAQRKKRALLEAAQQEFLESGFRGASMRRIAERAGVSTRTLYNHYNDKFALFGACLEKSSQDIQVELTDIAGGLQERLVAYTVEMQEQLGQESSIQVARMLYREGLEFEEIQRLARRQFYRYQVEPVERILDGHIANADERLELASHFVAMALDKWQRCVIFDEKPPGASEIRRHAVAVTDLFLGGARAKIAQNPA